MITSIELYNRVNELRIKKCLSLAKLSVMAGISHGTLDSWRRRGTMPTLEVLEGLSDALQVPMYTLLYDPGMDKLAGDEVELLDCWKNIEEKDKAALLAIMKSLSKSE